MTGTSFAQGISLAITPILTRVYTPEDFGFLALFMSILSVLAVLATGRYEYAIMLPKNNKDAINIVFLSILISILISLTLFLIIFIYDYEIAELLGNLQILEVIYFLPIIVLLSGLYQTFNYWNSRNKHYKNISISLLSKSAITSSSSLYMGFSHISNGLILGQIFGQLFATFIIGVKTWKDGQKYIININKLKMIVLAKRYIKLPIYNLPNALLDTLKNAGLNILISKLFSNSILGQFSLSWKMLQTPMTLIGGSLSQVFYQKLSVTSKHEMTKLIKKFLFKNILIALPLFSVIFIYAEVLFSFIFGEQWRLAGTISSIISPWIFLNFLTSPLATIFIILNRQGTLLIFALFYMMTPLLIMVYFQNKDFLIIINYISLSMSLLLLIFLYLIFSVIKKETK